MKNLILMIVVFSFVSCAHHKTKILDTQAVSMTKTSLEANEKLEMKGPIAAEYCPDTMNDQGQIGLMDEVIKRAQDQHQVDYIINASFWTSVGCISIEGDGAKVVSSKK